jgi:4-amino-4-deoxy-L-arabinose transferase-like glycosyltransferase
MPDVKQPEEAAEKAETPAPKGTAVPEETEAEARASDGLGDKAPDRAQDKPQENGTSAKEPGAGSLPPKKKKKKKKAPLGPSEDGNGDSTRPEPIGVPVSPFGGEARTDEAAAKKDELNPLLQKGNALRWARGGVTAGLGIFFTYLLMAENGQLAFGVPSGILGVLVAAWGVMDMLGTFDDAAETVETSTTLSALLWPIGQTVCASLLFLFALAGAISGRWSQLLWGGIVTVAFLALVASVFDLGVKLGPWAKDELGLSRPIWKREGFWLIVIATLLLVPFLGNYSLWDPWETHYGEVSREILARDDWISLWWAQDGWFWSKPILDFWIQAIFMATLGVHYKADQMLMGVGGPNAHPEWAVRTPVFLLVIVAMYVLYKGAAKAFGRRAGFLGAIVLATMTDWYFLAHQTMTDMPFVAPMTTAMGLVMLGLFSPEETAVKTYEVKAGTMTLRLSGWHLVFGAILVSALPQILYLFSRNLELVIHGSGPYGFHAKWDEFRSGSAGNCGSPGNEACSFTSPASIPANVRTTVDGAAMVLWRAVGAFEPFLQALVWGIGLGLLLYLNWGERRVRRLYYLAAWYFAAVATMGKGPAGFGLPMLCAFAYVCTTRRWKELLRFEMMSGLLIILVVAIPWYVAMYVRHGSPFTDRLIFHDMFNRAFHHVHDTNEGDDTSFRFYVWQLGYALFPWTGLVPLGLIWWLRRPDAQTSEAGKVRDPSRPGASDGAILLVMWFVFSFALFSFMGTKFHHYIFPAVPPAAMLLGVTLDEIIGEGKLLPKKSPILYLAAVGSSVALVVAGLARFWPGSLLGDKGEHSDPTPASFGMAAVLLGLGLALFVVSLFVFRLEGTEAQAPEATEPPPSTEGGAPYRGDPEKQAERAAIAREEERRRGHEQLMLSGAAFAGALITGLIGRDLAIKPENADQPGSIRLLHLFTYNYRRAWPDTLDFSAVLTGFVIVACVLCLAMGVRAIRRPILVAFFGFGVAWALWGIDVYMVKTAPHWGQREIMQAYYADRKSPDEPLIAYQMNWKGENFYTGNHIPAFVSSGATFTSWLKTQKEKGVKVMYFVTEHGRIGGLKSEVKAQSYKEVTDRALNNKFIIVRAVL